jgi:hypothetical protein
MHGPTNVKFSHIKLTLSSLLVVYIALYAIKHYIGCSDHISYRKPKITVNKLNRWGKRGSRRSQWPRGLRRRSAAARQLRLWVRIPPQVWMFVCCVCCVLSGRGLCDELITRPEESYRLWYVVVCDLETSRMRRAWPALGRSATERGKEGKRGGGSQFQLHICNVSFCIMCDFFRL